ncbi:MAG: helix-turn-helix domain-containing protein [Xenococcus sp. (in: cyanobacteria)]
MQLLSMPRELRFVCALSKLLKDKGWTQTDLHNHSGVSKTTIRSLMKGGKLERIDRGSTQRLLETLGCSFDDLWKITWVEDEND